MGFESPGKSRERTHIPFPDTSRSRTHPIPVGTTNPWGSRDAQGIQRPRECQEKEWEWGGHILGSMKSLEPRGPTGHGISMDPRTFPKPGIPTGPGIPAVPRLPTAPGISMDPGTFPKLRMSRGPGISISIPGCPQDLEYPWIPGHSQRPGCPEPLECPQCPGRAAGCPWNSG